MILQLTSSTGPFVGLVLFLHLLFAAMPFDVSSLAVYPTLIALTERARPLNEVAALDTALVVLDTNVVLDLWYWHDAKAQALQAVLNEKRLIPVVSCACLMELADVVSRAKFALADTAKIALLEEYGALAQIVSDPVRCPHTVRDPDDQKFLDLAVAVRARWLVTKDKLLLKAARREKGGLKALEPARFAALSEIGQSTAQFCT